MVQREVYTVTYNITADPSEPFNRSLSQVLWDWTAVYSTTSQTH